MTNLDIRRYSRNIFDVEAVQITDENIAEVARWINPNYTVLGSGLTKRIMLPFKDSKGRLQKSPAHVGSWVVKSVDGTFRCYSNTRFKTTFMEDRYELVMKALEEFGFDNFMQGQIAQRLKEYGVL